jgi:hypothetical protein
MVFNKAVRGMAGGVEKNDREAGQLRTGRNAQEMREVGGLKRD